MIEIDLLATILGQKIMHKFMIYKGIQSSVTIPVNELLAVRITSKDKDFCIVEIITSGMDSPIPFHIVARPKIVNPALQKPKLKQTELQEEELL